MNSTPPERRPGPVSPIVVVAVLLWLAGLLWGVAALEPRLQPLPAPIRDTTR